MKLVIKGHYWNRKKLIVSIISGLCFLIFGLVINYLAGNFADRHMSNPVNDLILDRIPAMDVDGIFLNGIIIFFLFVASLLFWQPRRMPYVLKTFSLFIIVRSFFIVLTHVGPSIHQVPLENTNVLVNAFVFTGDLFFSGHTGLPFLMALIFWNNKALRNLFLVTAVFFGAIVLLGHYHYSIDVFAAFFITFGVYKISEKCFEKDFHLFHSVDKGARGAKRSGSVKK